MFYSCRSPIQNCNASFRLPQWTVTAQSLASWQFSIDVEYLNKSRLQLCCLTGAELSAAGWTAVSLFFSLVQSFETLEVFDLEAVDLSWWIQSADSGGCDCCIWTQLQSYGFFFIRAYAAHFPVTLISLLLCSSMVPPLRGEWPPACVPCVALPAVTQGMDPGRLTAGSPAVPRDQQSFAVLCLTATVAVQCGHWRAILDWNSSIPLSNQTNTTLKVSTNSEKNTDNIRAVDLLFVCRPW